MQLDSLLILALGIKNLQCFILYFSENLQYIDVANITAKSYLCKKKHPKEALEREAYGYISLSKLPISNPFWPLLFNNFVTA